MASKTQTFNTRQHMQKDTFEVFHYRDNYPREVALHHHDFYEIYYFLSGNVQYNIESRSYLLTAGDVLLISPMELHQPMFGKEQRGYERIVLWVNKNFLEQMNLGGEDLVTCFDTSRPGHTNLLHPDGSVRQLLTAQLERLLEEGESQEFGSQLYAFSCLVQVLVTLNRQAQREYRESEGKTGSNSVVYSVLAYINEHYSEELSLDLLANKFYVSKYHLSREFNRLVGTSVYRYIIQKRLVMAKQMMSEGMSSTIVYQHCGFGDYSNFYRAFKSEYQISPKEFTAAQKGASNRSHFIRERLEGE